MDKVDKGFNISMESITLLGKGKVCKTSIRPIILQGTKAWMRIFKCIIFKQKGWSYRYIYSLEVIASPLRKWHDKFRIRYLCNKVVFLVQVVL